MKRNARVDGLTETKANLRDIPAIVVEEVVELIDQWGDNTLAETDRRVPRGETGDLANSYDKTVRDDGLQSAVGSDLHRAKYTEFGTRTQPAQPHLYPGFRFGNRQFRADAKQLPSKLRARVKRLRKPRKRA